MSEAEIYDQIRKVAETTMGEASPYSKDELFPDNNILKINLSLTENPSYLWKLAWLLGEDFALVSPYPVVESSLDDHAYRDYADHQNRGNPWSHYYGKQYKEWADTLKSELGDTCPKLLPAFGIDLRHNFDFDDDAFSIKHVSIAGTNFNTMLQLGDKELLNKKSISIDIPTLIVSDKELLDRLLIDFPIASKKLKGLLDESLVRLSGELDEEEKRKAIQLLYDEVVRPGVEEIRAEHREIFKSAALRSSVDVIGVTGSFFLAYPALEQYMELLLRLVSSGLGLRLLHRVLGLRDNLVKIRTKPFFFAMKFFPK